MKRYLAAAAAALALLLPVSASAERADALKGVDIEADTGDVDEVSQAYVVTGNVVITRGTMVVKSDRAEIKEAPDGWRTFVLTAAPGKRATYRQKRDGGPDLWAEGEAQRIEYDERTDVIKLFTKAIVRQLEGKKVTQQLAGEFLSYDNRAQVFVSRNDASGVNKPGAGRVTIHLEPNRKPAANPPAAPASGQQ